MTASIRKKQSLKKDTVLVYIGYVLRFLSQIILVPYYSRILGPTSYGQVLAAMSFMAIISVVIGYGFALSGARDIASAEGRAEKSAILSRQMGGRLILLPIAVIIGIIGTLSSPSLSGNVWFGILGTFLGIMNGFSLIWMFQGLRLFRASILLEAMAYPINIGLVLLFVRGPDDGLNALVALCVSSVICFISSLYYAKKYADFVRQKLIACFQEIKTATVFFGTSFSFTILTAGSTYILSLMATPTDVGYYGAAEKFVTFGISFLGPMGQVLMPTISNLHKTDSAAAHRVARKGLLLEVTYGLAAPLAGTILAPYIIPLILGPEFKASVTLFQIMMWIYPFAAFKHAIILFVLVPMRQEKYYLFTSATNVILNLGTALVLVPLFGATGMACARVTGEFMATSYLLSVIKKLHLLKILLQKPRFKLF